jgi:hypothetical protein
LTVIGAGEFSGSGAADLGQTMVALPGPDDRAAQFGPGVSSFAQKSVAKPGSSGDDEPYVFWQPR